MSSPSSMYLNSPERLFMDSYGAMSKKTQILLVVIAGIIAVSLVSFAIWKASGGTFT